MIFFVCLIVNVFEGIDDSSDCTWYITYFSSCFRCFFQPICTAIWDSSDAVLCDIVWSRQSDAETSGHNTRCGTSRQLWQSGSQTREEKGETISLINYPFREIYHDIISFQQFVIYTFMHLCALRYIMLFKEDFFFLILEIMFNAFESNSIYSIFI